MPTNQNPAVHGGSINIVTHSGQAHADDLLALALILIKEANGDQSKANILRVANGKAEDWPHAKFVVDIGKQYDPVKGWFDHHHFPKDAPPDCAFTLIAKHYGIARDSMNWIERLALLDSKGPFVWFEATFGRPAKNMTEINNFLDPDVFNWFTRSANMTYKNPMAFFKALDMVIPWLENELSYAEKKGSNIEFARSHLQIMDMGSFKFAFFNQREMRGVGELCDIIAAEDPSIIVSGKPDDRGDGFSATRWNNSMRVDFLPCKDETNCVFAHENGFCLKWKNDWDSFLDAVKRSVKEAT